MRKRSRQFISDVQASRRAAERRLFGRRQYGGSTEAVRRWYGDWSTPLSGLQINPCTPLAVPVEWMDLNPRRPPVLWIHLKLSESGMGIVDELVGQSITPGAKRLFKIEVIANTLAGRLQQVY
ncbi:hypothetical protein FOMG_18361 [Fusarium oxysporum f. sp. melonis 26406]|uniref:Uncharacterized protein n=1 Tax=Fusarium oxysporum f. sp. melonis 26406 TaxID=1089452 RepID=W9Z0Q0_FUSOX|nr:hypothetical protein FOMG_18361 [Fusarium oxysporum f. sp. melonis 26406]